MARPIRRGPTTWRLHCDGPPDPITSRRNQQSRTFHGTVTEAKLAQAAFELEVRGVTKVATNQTVGQLLDVWLLACRSWVEDQTYTSYESTARLYLRPILGDIPLADLRPHHLNTMYDTLTAGGHAGPGLKPTTVRRIHQIIRTALSYAEDNEWVVKNAAKSGSTRPPKIIRKKPVTPQSSDIARLVGALTSTNNHALAAFVEVVTSTGMRPGEVCGLQWEDVDWSVGAIHVSKSVQQDRKVKPTKTDRDRWVTVDDQTLALLKEYRPDGCESGDYLFSSGRPARPWAPNWATCKINEVRDGLGLGPVNPRALRHYVATQLIGNGADIPSVSARLGHVNINTTLNSYTEWLPGNDRENADLLRKLRDVHE